MADAICRWRNGTPKTVVELVNSLPHEMMTIDAFRVSMVDKWDGDFFRTAYQLACQLALYCEGDDGYYYPRFDHDINDSEAEEYLLHWFPRYYVPNPYTRKDGFLNIPCPTYFLRSLYNYAIDNPNCLYKDAYEACFHESAKNNDDIIKNYINKYSRVLTFSKDGTLNITSVNPLTVFPDMDRNNKKEFFDSFNKNHKPIQREYSLQQIYYGAPGTGKSHEINKIVTEENSIRTTFHPDSDYASFVGCYKPIAKTADGENQEITYDFVPQAFTKAYIAAWKDTSKPYYLVIEEINRGNCAQIFGDIFQLLDRGEDGYSSYEITPDTDLQQHLAKTFKDVAIEDEKIKKGETMRLPGNLHILATMNTSDQSLFPIDSAFKRRWEWKYIPIKNEEDKNHKIVVGKAKYDWWKFMEIVNKRIEDVTDSEDKQIGYWFAKANASNEISAETLVSKVLFYLWNDVFKDYAYSTSSLFQTEKRKYKLREFYDNNGEVNTALLNQFLSELKLENEALQPEEPQSAEE